MQARALLGPVPRQLGVLHSSSAAPRVLSSLAISSSRVFLPAVVTNANRANGVGLVGSRSESSWLGKMGKMVGLGKDAPEETPSDDIPKVFNVDSYFSMVNKAKWARKMGMGGMMDKMMGGADSRVIDEVWGRHDKIKSVLSQEELQMTAPKFSPQRLTEIATLTGYSETELHQVFGMFTNAKQAYAVLEQAKKSGKMPKTVEEMQSLFRDIQGNIPRPPQPTPQPQQQAQQAQQTATASQPQQQASSGAYGYRAQPIRSDRFVPSPKKGEENPNAAPKFGRNDWVTISNDTETQKMKWKKAQILVESGKWKIVG